MLIIDSKSGEIRDANLIACSFYGYSIEELCKLNISDINMLSRQEILEKLKCEYENLRSYLMEYEKNKRL